MKCKNCNNLYNLTDIKGEIVGRCCPKINDSVDIEIDRACNKLERLEEKIEEHWNYYNDAKRTGNIRQMDYSDGCAEGFTTAIKILNEEGGGE